jgi:hypothetical protein
MQRSDVLLQLAELLLWLQSLSVFDVFGRPS